MPFPQTAYRLSANVNLVAPPFVRVNGFEVCLERCVHSDRDVSPEDWTPWLSYKPDAPPSVMASGRSFVAQEPTTEVAIVTDIFVMVVTRGAPNDVSTQTGCIEIAHRQITRSELPGSSPSGLFRAV